MIIESNLQTLWHGLSSDNRYGRVLKYVDALGNKKFSTALVKYVLSCSEELAEFELCSGFNAFLEVMPDTEQVSAGFKITLDQSNAISMVKVVKNQANPISIHQIINRPLS